MITQQIGNYFIMDSEQLVSKPYHEMQNEALSEAGKKSSNNDKHTSVKNNVCENHFSLARSQLEREKDNRLRNLHENTSRLRYEVKLLDLNRRKNEVELRKRIEPKKDFTYDDTQLSKTEKRLGANIESHYLARRLRYPVRAKATADLVVTPVVAKARKTLRETKRRPDSERAPTAKSVSSVMTVDSSNVRESRYRSKWPPSRSAPHTASSSASRSRSQDVHSRLPKIHQQYDGSLHHSKRRGSPQRVKFAFESPHKLIVSDNGGKSMNPNSFMVRAHTYHEGMGRRSNYYDSSSDNDNDDDESERIDLRAIFFGKSKDDDNMSTKSHPLSHSVATFNSGTGIRRSHGAPRQNTQEKLRREAKAIQNKINDFLHRLETDPPIKRRGYYEDESEEEEMIETEDNTIPIFLRKNRHPAVEPPKKVEPKKKVEPPQAKEEAPKVEEAKSDDEDKSESEDESEKDEKRQMKDAWKYIRGHVDNGSLRGTYTAADLVLQQLTGVLVGRGKRPTVPLHAASRAMRHTATFKMRKVVESLIESRTRYEQHEVNELKKKMDGEVEVLQAVQDGDTQQEVPSVQ